MPSVISGFKTYLAISMLPTDSQIGRFLETFEKQAACLDFIAWSMRAESFEKILIEAAKRRLLAFFLPSSAPQAVTIVENALVDRSDYERTGSIDSATLNETVLRRLEWMVSNQYLLDCMPEYTIKDLLHVLRRVSFEYPQFWNRLDPLCEAYSNEILSQDGAKPADYMNKPDSMQIIYRNLLCREHIPKAIKGTHAATAHIFAWLDHLVGDIARCEQYLARLNDKFRVFCEVHDVDLKPYREACYSSVAIDRRIYMIRGEGQPKLPKKHSIFQRFLYQYFVEEADLPDHYVMQWIGFLPHDVANQYLIDGHLFYENKFGNGVFHGKFSHLILLALISEALREETPIQNPKYAIDLRQLLRLLVTEKVLGRPAWSRFVDQYVRYYGVPLKFSEPHALSCHLMRFGDQYAPDIAAVVRDSFDKGVRKLQAAMIDYIPDLGSLPLRDFLQKWGQMDAGYFFKHPFLHEWAIRQQETRLGDSSVFVPVRVKRYLDSSAIVFFHHAGIERRPGAAIEAQAEKLGAEFRQTVPQVI